jgi:hypothetical protein
MHPRLSEEAEFCRKFLRDMIQPVNLARGDPNKNRSIQFFLALEKAHGLSIRTRKAFAQAEAVYI